MKTPFDSIEMYLRAKDLNRPHLMAQAFTGDAVLQMEVRQGGISFPPMAQGREAITDTLVRNFGSVYENIYTFCLAEPPAAAAAAAAVTDFDCHWLVVMTEKQSRAVRVGCGVYQWRFDTGNQLVRELRIVIEAMHTLPAAATEPVLDWASALPSPWCSLHDALAAAPAIAEVRSVLDLLAGMLVSAPADTALA